MRDVRRSPGSRRYHSQLHYQATTSHGIGDPFDEHPLRRSLTVVLACSAVLGIACVAGGQTAAVIMLSVGWMAITALIFCVPILVWSLIEIGVDAVNRRLSPPIGDLDISQRVANILLRHGYETIDDVHRTDDHTLLLLSNMDARGLHEVRRAISLWRYRRWQEAGFPAGQEYE